MVKNELRLRVSLRNITYNQFVFLVKKMLRFLRFKKLIELIYNLTQNQMKRCLESKFFFLIN